MATYNPQKNRWYWTLEEMCSRRKQCRFAKDCLRDIDEECHDHISQYVRKYSDVAFNIFATIDAALHHVLKVRLKESPEYPQKVSPEEFDRVLAMLPELMRPWNEMVSSKDFLDEGSSHGYF